jgi:hypothetical protein
MLSVPDSSGGGRQSLPNDTLLTDSMLADAVISVPASTQCLFGADRRRPFMWRCFRTGIHLFRFRLFRFPVRDHEQRRGSRANRFVHKKAFAIHHIVFRSVRKPEQGNRLTEATLLEVNHWNSHDVPVVGSIKELLAVAASSRVVTTAERNLCNARGTRCEGPHDNFD